MGVKEIARLSRENLVGEWLVDISALKESVRKAFGDKHIHRPVDFGIEGTHEHGVVCADCGYILQWGN